MQFGRSWGREFNLREIITANSLVGHSAIRMIMALLQNWQDIAPGRLRNTRLENY